MDSMLPYSYHIEMLQAFIAALGATFLIWSLWDAIKDGAALKEASVNGTRMLIAMNNVRAEMAKLLIVLAFFVSGVVQMTLPPPTTYTEDDPRVAELVQRAREIDPRIVHESRQQRTGIVVARSVSIFICVVLVVDSIAARRMRYQFVRRVNARGDRRYTDAGVESRMNHDEQL